MTRTAMLLVVLSCLGGCVPNRSPESAPPPGGVPPGQWTPDQAPSPQGPAPQQPQGWNPDYPGAPPPQQPWTAPPPPAQPAPAPQQQPWAWPADWTLPIPIAWPAAPPPAAPPPGGSSPPAQWPSLPGLPGWPGQVQPAPVAPAAPATPGGGDAGQRCVDRINGYRATKGLPALARWTEAETCAAGEAADDARSQKPHGSFGACREGAQNACPNWPGPADRMIDGCLQMMWNEGPGEFPAHGHYMNMVDTRSTKVACAIHTMADGRLWAVQDFR